AGFIDGGRAHWPDVVVARGPSGSALFMEFLQLHRGDDGTTWTSVYDDDFAHIRSYDLDARSGVLRVRAGDPDTRREEESVIRLTNGGRVRPSPRPTAKRRESTHSR